MSSRTTVQPLKPPVYPPSAALQQLTPGYNYSYQRVHAIPAYALSTGSKTATLTASTSPGIPTNAVALIGIYGRNAANATYPYQVQVSVTPDSENTVSHVNGLVWIPSRSFWGSLPIQSASTIGVTLGPITAQSGSPAETGNAGVDLVFALSNSAPLSNSQLAIPFQSDNGDMESVAFEVSQTSAAATAQTIDLAPAQAVEYEITAAWFTAGGAIIGTMNYFTIGGTAVPIVTSASATTGDLTPNPRRSVLGNASHAFRMSLPSAGVGNTSTGIIHAIARQRT